jgi:hypothetical protein
VYVQDPCTVCAEHTTGSEIILDELLGDMGHVGSCFGPFVDSAILDARLVHGLGRTYCTLENHFRCTRWNSKVTWVKWNLVSVCLEIMLVSGAR